MEELSNPPAEDPTRPAPNNSGNNCSSPLLRAYYMAGSLLTVLHALAHLVPITSSWVAQRGDEACSRSHSYPAADSEFQPGCLGLKYHAAYNQVTLPHLRPPPPPPPPAPGCILSLTDPATEGNPKSSFLAPLTADHPDFSRLREHREICR